MAAACRLHRDGQFTRVGRVPAHRAAAMTVLRGEPAPGEGAVPLPAPPPPTAAGAAVASGLARLGMASGVFALTWSVVVVLMIVRPGSTTGV